VKIELKHYRGKDSNSSKFEKFELKVALEKKHQSKALATGATLLTAVHE
jgi:hypothetical protein